MSLLEQSLWWIIPYVLMMLVMLHAMMEFTVSLLARRPRTKRKPIGARDLGERLLALNERDGRYILEQGQDCDLQIVWRMEGAPKSGFRGIAKSGSHGRIRLLLDERRHELRINEVTRSYSLVLGFEGWLPRVAGYYAFQAGPPGEAMTQEIARVANLNGWVVRPVIWWFQATYRGYGLLEAFTPGALRDWPARRLWGILYPLSFALGMGYFVAINGLQDSRSLLLIAGISASWWGLWGFLVWMLRGFPSFWRLGRR